MSKKLSRKENFEKYQKIALKGTFFKPFVFRKLFRYSPPKRRENIENCIEMYTQGLNITKKEQLYLKRDLAYCKVKHNIIFKEYFLYGLRHKSEFERKKFIFNLDRQKYLYLLGNEEGQKTLRDKYKAYLLLKKYYKRDIELIESTKDQKKFDSYIKKHPIFVKKPIDASFGNGIELIDSSKYKNKSNLFKEIVKECPLILEEQIISDDKVASLHPESLNTIRVVTYRDSNDDVHIHIPFIKIGQGDAFVDNGGAGGMFALIDSDTGKIISDAKDELNTVYEYHPDSKIKIKGFQIPKWDEIIDLAKRAALDFKDTRYIGWDVALSKDKGPVIVEGNGKGQFYGQQMLDETGKRCDLEKLINYKELKKLCKDVKYWELPSPKKVQTIEGEKNEK